MSSEENKLKVEDTDPKNGRKIVAINEDGTYLYEAPKYGETTTGTGTNNIIELDPKQYPDITQKETIDKFKKNYLGFGKLTNTTIISKVKNLVTTSTEYNDEIADKALNKIFIDGTKKNFKVVKFFDKDDKKHTYYIEHIDDKVMKFVIEGDVILSKDEQNNKTCHLGDSKIMYYHPDKDGIKYLEAYDDEPFEIDPTKRDQFLKDMQNKLTEAATVSSFDTRLLKLDEDEIMDEYQPDKINERKNKFVAQNTDSDEKKDLFKEELNFNKGIKNYIELKIKKVESNIQDNTSEKNRILTQYKNEYENQKKGYTDYEYTDAKVTQTNYNNLIDDNAKIYKSLYTFITNLKSITVKPEIKSEKKKTKRRGRRKKGGNTTLSKYRLRKSKRYNQ